MSILVLGGAGYVGSHAVQALVERGYDTAVVDNLVTGHREAINEKARFYEGDIRDQPFLTSVFEQEDVEAVIHFAASSLVGESVSEPLKYWDNNVSGTRVVLDVMKEADVKHIVFSSTAATYGEPEQVPITEDMPERPTNPYGETKLAMEKLMRWCEEAYGIRYVSLRYFNVAGAGGSIGEDHEPETHLIPLVLKTALGQRESISIFGNDYDTPDGTCIRDYVHVEDLIDAHLLAINYLQEGKESGIFNLGSSQGFSVKEIIETSRQVTGQQIQEKIAPRRKGDPARLIASSDKARSILGWTPTRTTIERIISDAWEWHKGHPRGYNDQKGADLS
ncbi:UDP-glucose 4-epimerase GalE [Rossellomorea marisflavi]|uniref:UDP-glucose 4-epimerase n=1 Tax=Rossellomorea marisflavi TaxID=189381 RepID=A0A5D4S0N0_9BACI|nr:UDP-glucose 4-epimerase GalE [Rossellomorea marisflavi]TYS57193.1 UDP-glucose 4-epimerase GalE [Rossellomorea marisflavi]